MESEIFYKRLGQNLKNLRRSKKMTQEQLGSILGITKSAVVNYETGIRKIPFDILVQIASLFKISVDSLVNQRPTLADILKDKLAETQLNEKQEHLLISFIEIILESSEESWQK